MKTYYKSKRIVLKDQVIDGFIVVEDDKIVNVTTENNNCPYVDYSDYQLLAGIFDTHNHGCYGWDLAGGSNLEENKAIVRSYLKALATQGVTAIFPTARLAMFEAIAEVAKEEIVGAKIVGIHSEGPWLNRVGEKGEKTDIPKVDLSVAKDMVKKAQGLLKLVALAPEIEGIDEVMDYFKSEGITLAFAHSDCNYEQAKASYKRGIDVITHTGNVMSGLHHRDLGGLGAALNDPDVMCEVICDGMHLSLDMVELYFKLKPMDKFMLISDNSSLGGLPEGKYHGRANEKDRAYLNITKDGFIVSDSGRLTGSSKPVIYGISNLVNKLHLPLCEVSKMASLNPATYYKFNDLGSLEIGKKADFIVVDNDFKVCYTHINGHKIYDYTLQKAPMNELFYESKRVK